VDNFRLGKDIKEKLKEKGITHLFPIQTQTFDHIYDGKDLIARGKQHGDTF
jgi:ATP-dependent RNA helicase DDX21